MTKKGQESPVKEQNCRFLPVIFANTGHLERCTPLNDVFFFFEFLVENKAFHFSKRALRGVPHAVSD